jgi:hypothetical protein
LISSIISSVSLSVQDKESHVISSSCDSFIKISQDHIEYQVFVIFSITQELVLLSIIHVFIVIHVLTLSLIVQELLVLLLLKFFVKLQEINKIEHPIINNIFFII